MRSLWLVLRMVIVLVEECASGCDCENFPSRQFSSLAKDCYESLGVPLIFSFFAILLLVAIKIEEIFMPIIYFASI